MTPISNELFQNSLRHVRRELKALGFDREKVMETKAYRTFIPSLRAQAYFTHDGDIYIPMFQSKKNVRDMLRHEYGHALLFHYPEISGDKGFVYFGHSKNGNDYVSKYAMTDPNEDFCETFTSYMKHKGKLPLKKSSPRFMKKWRFIKGLRRCRGSS